MVRDEIYEGKRGVIGHITPFEGNYREADKGHHLIISLVYVE